LGAVEINDIVDNRYRIIKQVGEGGLGRVFKAEDLKTKSFVALKFLHERLLEKEHLLGIFHRELLISSGFEHKNIISYRGSQFDPPNCYIVNDFVDGWNGHQFSKKVGKVPPMVALSICVDLLTGLDYLHMHDVVHSDLSISNMMINREGRILLADFGLSFESGIETYKDKQFGTPGYVSPEHITAKKISEKSDIYCVGLIFWQLLTGEKLLPSGKDPEKTIKAMRERDLSNLQINQFKLRYDILKILKKSLSYHQFFRYKTAQQMLLDCYKLMRKHNVGYARNAIWQFLDDNAMTEKPFQAEKQNIYLTK
jgi:serine/threonine protein kinase